jgi:hypothetical protein
MMPGAFSVARSVVAGLPGVAPLELTAALVMLPVNAITFPVEATINAIALVVQAPVSAVALAVEPSVDAVALAVQAIRGTIMTGSSSTFRGAIQAPVNPIALVIETIVKAIATTVQAIVDSITALVEALLDAVAAIVDVIRDEIGVVGHYSAAQQQQASDDHSGLRCIPYGPCIHVVTPKIQTFPGCLNVQRAESQRVDTP